MTTTSSSASAPAGAVSSRDVVSDELRGVQRWLLALVVLFLGGSGLVYEYCLSTVAAHLLGNSIEQFSIIIALMLFAMGAAGAAQRRLRRSERLAELFVTAEILLGVIGGASAIALYVAFAFLEHFRLVLYVLAFSIGFGIGLEIPLLMRINQRYQPELRDNVGQVLSLDYIGALVGALVWAFVLLPLLPLDRISLILGLINVGVAALTLVMFRRRLRRPALVVLGALVLVASGALVALASYAPALSRLARQHLYSDPVRHRAQSAYQQIVITGRGARMSLYLNGRLQFDSEDEHIYHEMLVHPALMALRRAPRDVLVLGGGDGLAVREVLEYDSVRSVTLVDLDPAMTELARTYEPLVRLNRGALRDDRVRVRPARGVSAGAPQPVEKRAERLHLDLRGHRERVATVRVLHLDADRFIHGIGTQRYDAIIADFPDPRTFDLAKLYSVELYRGARRRLRPGGVLVTQAGSPYTARRAFWCIVDTVAAAGYQVLPLNVQVPTFGRWGFVLAGRDRRPDPRGEPPVDTRFVTARTLRAARSFAPPYARPDAQTRCESTRLDPKVMRLYGAGEPLAGPRIFPGAAER